MQPGRLESRVFQWNALCQGEFIFPSPKLFTVASSSTSLSLTHTQLMSGVKQCIRLLCLTKQMQTAAGRTQKSVFLGSICRLPHGALGRLAWGCFLTRLWGGNGDFVRAQVACVVDGSVVMVVVVMVLTGDGAAGLQQPASPACVCGTNICAGVCASKQGYWSALDCVTLSSTDRLTRACLRSPTVPTEPVTSPAAAPLHHERDRGAI